MWEGDFARGRFLAALNNFLHKGSDYQMRIISWENNNGVTISISEFNYFNIYILRNYYKNIINSVKKCCLFSWFSLIYWCNGAINCKIHLT